MDESFMRLALRKASLAAKHREVPVGAVIVREGQVVASGYNLREKRQCATAHAELIAIQRACKKLGSWRLSGCDLYVTLEPCPMCAGAIIQSRIGNVYFGAFDAKAGAAGSVLDLFNDFTFNHHVNVQGGILKDDCQKILSEFFLQLRKRKD